MIEDNSCKAYLPSKPPLWCAIIRNLYYAIVVSSCSSYSQYIVPNWHTRKMSLSQYAENPSHKTGGIKITQTMRLYIPSGIHKEIPILQ